MAPKKKVKCIANPGSYTVKQLFYYSTIILFTKLLDQLFTHGFSHNNLNSLEKRYRSQQEGCLLILTLLF